MSWDVDTREFIELQEENRRLREAAEAALDLWDENSEQAKATLRTSLKPEVEGD